MPQAERILADNQSPDGLESGDAEIGPGIYALKETLFFGRTAGSHRVAALRVTDEATSLPSTSVLHTSDLTSNFQPGMRFVIGWRPEVDRALELSYFGIFNWHASLAAQGNNNLALPGDLGGGSRDYFAADALALNYRSQLNSVEANVLQSSGGLSVLGGFRYLSVYETLNVRSLDVDSGTGTYLLSTTNNLFGGQLGARFSHVQNRFAWDATGKLAVLGNGASEWQFVTDAVPTGFLRERSGDSDVHLAFVGELNMSVNYRLFRFLTLRAGYNLLGLQGVALAPAQLDFSNAATSGTQVHAGGGFLAHGVSAGGLADW